MLFANLDNKCNARSCEWSDLPISYRGWPRGMRANLTKMYGKRKIND